MSEDCWTHFVLLLVALCPQGVLSLKLLRVSVPQFTLKGHKAILQCQYDLEDDKLYSVTWYKDHEEFYRYVLRSNPPQHSYHLEGVKLDHQDSDAQQVVLKSVNLKSSGLYRCEVSAEAPSFTSVHGEGRMEVVSLPQDGPEIMGEERFYQVGDVLSLNCTSGKSYPPARLRWYVNDIHIKPDYERMVQHQGLVTTMVGLRLEVRPHHFLEGRMQVRCVATIPAMPLNHHRAPHDILEDRREALILVEGGSMTARSSSIILVTVTSLSIWFFAT